MKDIQTISLPYFPELSSGKSNRVITKHFTNAAMCLPQNEFAMLIWLVYQSKSDNTIVYSTQLLATYSAAIKAAEEMYKESQGLAIGIKAIRGFFRQLVQKGYLLPNYNKKVFTINPMLSYRVDYVKQVQYKEVVCAFMEICRYYAHVDPKQYEFHILRDFTCKYSKLAVKKKIAK